MKPTRARQNGWDIWLYKRPLCHRILRFLLLQRRYHSSLIYETRSLLAVVQPLQWIKTLSALLTSPQTSPLLVPAAAVVLWSPAAIWWALLENFSVLLQIPCHYCRSCRAPLHAADSHGECTSCLGSAHAEAALTGTECPHCEDMSLTSLCKQIAFFSESNSAPRYLPLSSSQEPVRKRQRGRGHKVPEMSELKPAQTPHASLSPRLFLPCRPASFCGCERPGLVRGSENEALDDSVSIAAFPSTYFLEMHQLQFSRPIPIYDFLGSVTCQYRFLTIPIFFSKNYYRQHIQTNIYENFNKNVFT